MHVVARFGALALMAGSSLGLTGCRYALNRYYDFRDMLAVGVGATAENPVTGWVPPSLGVYLELTDFLHLGAITHNGYTAEMDLRGAFAGPEYRTRFGFLWWQMLQINQDYENGWYNRFKDPSFPWTQRMSAWGMRSHGHPAKRLNYEYWSQYRQYGQFLKPRGWQYWEYTGLEVAICDPFFTHFGVMLRLGLDISEFSDFLLGIFGVDYKHDDMTEEEFALRNRRDIYHEEPARIESKEPMPAAPSPAAAPAPKVETPPPPPPPPPPTAEKAPEPLPVPPPPAAAAKERRRYVVQFDHDSSALKPAAQEIIQKIADQLKDDPKSEGYIRGYASSEGTEKYNLALSQRRSDAVKNRLTELGIEASRLFSVGLGEASPVADNATEEGRVKNRRVEVDAIPG